MDFLTTITKTKQQEVQSYKEHQAPNPCLSLFQAKKKPIIIAEVKPKSPSSGELYTKDPVELAKIYEEGGADMISVLTDQTYFGGSVELLKNIKQRVKVPVLRKEFIIDESQLIETFEAKADAVLLIAALVDERKLQLLYSMAISLRLFPIIEVYSMAEIRKALSVGAQTIAVNARDLRTMTVDLDHAFEILQIIPPHVTKLLFSGIKERADIEKAIEYGTGGVLIGTSLVSSDDPKLKLEELRGI